MLTKPRIAVDGGPSDRDRGSALIVTLMFIALLATLATTVSALAIGNLQSSQLVQEAGVAGDAAEAGLAEGVSYLRTNGVRSLCAEPSNYLPSGPTFDKALDLATQTCVDGPTKGTQVQERPYTVLIVTINAIGTSDVGRYLVYSTGVGGGAARRIATAEVEAKGVGVPKGGFFGHSVSGSGTAAANQSIFSTGCVYARDKITMSGIDSYGIPAAVHSSQIVNKDPKSTAPNCAVTNNSIHKSSPCYSPLDGAFDQDSLGGSLSGTSCLTSRSSFPAVSAESWAKYYASGSKIVDKDTMMALYGLKDPALTQKEIDELRLVAKTQPGNYRTTSSSSDSFTPSGTNAVLFYDLNDGKVDLGGITGFAPTTGACLRKSLTIIVSGGDVVFPSGGPLAASLIVTTPGKTYSATGGTLVGTAYADSITLGGNSTVNAADQQCFVANPSPSLLAFNVTSYREIDG
jgi:Tfp pilus assembly protein PilX